MTGAAYEVETEQATYRYEAESVEEVVRLHSLLEAPPGSLPVWMDVPEEVAPDE